VVKKGYSYNSTPPAGHKACTGPPCPYKGALYLDRLCNTGKITNWTYILDRIHIGLKTLSWSKDQRKMRHLHCQWKTWWKTERIKFFTYNTITQFQTINGRLTTKVNIHRTSVTHCTQNINTYKEIIWNITTVIKTFCFNIKIWRDHMGNQDLHSLAISSVTSTMW